MSILPVVHLVKSVDQSGRQGKLELKNLAVRAIGHAHHATITISPTAKSVVAAVIQSQPNSFIPSEPGQLVILTNEMISCSALFTSIWAVSCFMKSIQSAPKLAFDGILSDLDDTLSWEGKVVPEAFAQLARGAIFQRSPATIEVLFDVQTCCRGGELTKTK